MKYITLFFVLISAVAAGQSELSLNNNPVQAQVSTSNDVDIAAKNSDGNLFGNDVNAQVQINTNFNMNVQGTGNVQQKNDGIQIQIGGNRSRGAAAPSSTYTAGSGHKSYSLTKEISKKLKSIQYKHSGPKKFRRHSGKHSRGSILRCFS